MKKTLIASSVALTLGAANAQAALVTNLYGPYDFSTSAANFTMLAANGGVVGGTNDVNMVWDGNGYSSSTDYTGPGSGANVTASSTAPFFGHTWTAHDIQVFTPGSYSFDVTLGGGNPETGTLLATVGAGQLGMHMLFNWNNNNNIDVFVVASPGSVFGSGLLYSTVTNTAGKNKCDSSFTGTITKNCLFDGGPFGGPVPTKSMVWMLASTDPDGDGVMGIPMATGGPFAGFNANFNANMAMTPDAVPVPAAVWLFGSGLLGLVGIARRKKKA
jgi:hypothetical protein